MCWGLSSQGVLSYSLLCYIRYIDVEILSLHALTTGCNFNTIISHVKAVGKIRGVCVCVYVFHPEMRNQNLEQRININFV